VTAMSSLVELAFILVVVIDLFLLASSRLGAAIRTVAIQGALLATLPLLLLTDAHLQGQRTLAGLGQHHGGIDPEADLLPQSQTV